MEDTAEMRPELTDGAGVIQLDVACRRCGYNVRGLHHEGRCPECGTAIGLSCYGDLLRFADPEWVETLVRGLGLILWGILVMVVSVVLAIVLILVTRQTWLGSALGTLGSLVGVWGTWIVTRADPSGIGEDRYVSDRRIVRISLCIGMGQNALRFLDESLALTANWHAAFLLTALLAGLVGVVGEFARLTYFGKLAVRVPNEALAKRAQTLRWVMAISLGVVVLGSLGILLVSFLGVGGGGLGGVGRPTLLAPAGRPGAAVVAAPTTNSAFSGSAVTTLPAVPASAPVVGRAAAGGARGGMAAAVLVPACVVGVAGVVMFFASIAVLLLTIDLRKNIRRQAELARQTWVAAETPGDGMSWGAGRDDGSAVR